MSIINTVKSFTKIYIKVILLSWAYLGTSNIAIAQAYSDLNKKKLENLQQLSLSKTLLESTAESKKNTLNNLALIQHNITLRSELIVNISEEINYLEGDIKSNTNEIAKIESTINELKKQYAKIVVAASRNLDTDLGMMYILSSQDFNQAYQRIRYLKFLVKYRYELTKRLTEQENTLKEINKKLALAKSENLTLINERKKEVDFLNKDKIHNLSLVKTLELKEKELKRDISRREKIQSQVEAEIRRIIAEEELKAKKEKKGIMLTAEEKIISSDFSKNMGRLPWPSEKGIVIGKYGDQNHPVLKGIKIHNNGIDINTVAGAQIRNIFDGEVTKVISILGANNTVIVKHGEYRTVYQNLIDVKVRAGDKIKTKSVIGTVYTDDEGVSKFHFEIWKDKIIQNPESWLSR